jgi:hypothetical protein
VSLFSLPAARTSWSKRNGYVLKNRMFPLKRSRRVVSNKALVVEVEVDLVVDVAVLEVADAVHLVGGVVATEVVLAVVVAGAGNELLMPLNSTVSVCA